MVEQEQKSANSATTNACKLCAPLGACLAFRGIEGAVPFLHGSQGCATYIRRYLISHFREPMDIAASNFNEASAIFGGTQDFVVGLRNVARQYRPKLIGVATTCLSETIGEDMGLLMHEYRKQAAPEDPLVVHASTPSYCGTHADGFHTTVRALVDQLAQGGGERRSHAVVFPGLISPADLRHIKELCADFGVGVTLVPDISDPLDGPILDHYEKIPAGGTPVQAVVETGSACASIELSRTLGASTGATVLRDRFGVPAHRVGLPIGLNETDRFMSVLETLSGHAMPEKHRQERGRLIDAYVDGHKYVFGKRAIVYGEEDLAVGLCGFLSEVGIVPVVCASGGESGRLGPAVAQVAAEVPGHIVTVEGADFGEIARLARESRPDLIVGNSKGYRLARELEVPLVRVGFPIHDRLGGQRILHVGYRGAQRLFDEVANALIGRKQDRSGIGYAYM